ncbi:XRE family transcriptional regulator [Serratia sp. IR-2025]|uniref:XRE family transcriptional regulator n=1 Tax=Serratia marcescens TaxID=615 RepID=UPI0018D74854|nr:helix-turn-helix transcriptional regulator [Serratia marcescens]MBH2910390.1 helix-turn-helix transcriptional regulator [Serratia marcescens]HAU4354423.1 helix-turn-helix transcriptional regulator [Serratia marcescens]
MKMTLAQRLKAAMLAANLTQSALADLVGVSQAAIQKLASGKAKTSTKIVEIARALNVRPEWLSEESGPMTDESDSPYSRHHPDSATPPLEEWEAGTSWDRNTPLLRDEVEVPFLRDIELAAGDGSYNEEQYDGEKLRFSKATLRQVGASTDGKGVLCFPARGNSMEPNIPDGTEIAVNTNDKKLVDGKLYAINQNGWKRIRVLYRVGPDRISLRSYNSAEYEPEEKDINEVEIIGRVFWYAVLP